MITQDQLKDRCHYDPDTGVFIWRNPISNRVRAGDVVGYLNAKGYLSVNINRKHVPLHRLAWLYVYGEFPKNHIDHINGDKSDNRISNLRPCDHAQNMQNQRRPRADNKSGFLGVSRTRKNQINPWVAQISLNKKVIYLGSFSTPEAAHQAYVAKKREIHSFGVI